MNQILQRLSFFLWVALFFFPAIISSQSLENTEAYKSCNDLFEEKNWTDLITCVDAILKSEEDQLDYINQTQIYYYLAKANFGLRDFEAYKEAATEGCKAAQNAHLKNKEAYFNFALGVANRRNDEYNISIEYYLKALELYQQLNDSLSIGKTYNNLAIAYQSSGDFNKSFESLEKGFDIRRDLGDTLGMANILINRGNSHEYLNNYEEALKCYLEAQKYYEAVGADYQLGNSLTNIGLVYQNLNDNTNALKYYFQAQDIAIETEDMEGLAVTYQNIGNLYSEDGAYDKNIEYQNKALDIYKAEDDLTSQGEVLLNIGLAYLELSDYIKATNYLNQALEITSNDKQSYDYANNIIELGRLDVMKNNFGSAEGNLLTGLNQAKQVGDPYLEGYANKYLFELYEKTGNTAKALDYYKKYHDLQDSLNLLSQEQAVTDIMARFDFATQAAEIEILNKENELKEVEVQRAANQRNFSYLLLAFMGLLAWGIYFQFRYSKKINKVITKEKERAEELLLNILPDETAEELKEKGFVEAKRFDMTTVLFTDFVNFTNYAESVPPEEVVKSVDFYFSAFDKIMEEHYIEKIKTIGDAYMAVGGLPVPSTDNPELVVRAALAILHFVKETNVNPPEGIHPFNIRIGINTGPVVAGIVGIHKFQYDVWGNTVNIAARMESSCIPGRINLSESTYQEVKDKIQCSFRGSYSLKNSTKLNMYFVDES
ncbi:MAG: tetratricopeptide repeat protein [Saprospiraceae bacterium]|nr:tetratricopeptide repeat protein [Saprospiraceae bacterium]